MKDSQTKVGLIVIVVVILNFSFNIYNSLGSITYPDTKDQMITEMLVKRTLVIEVNKIIQDINTLMQKTEIDTPLVIQNQNLRDKGYGMIQDQDVKIQSLLNLIATK